MTKFDTFWKSSEAFDNVFVDFLWEILIHWSHRDTSDQMPIDPRAPKGELKQPCMAGLAWMVGICVKNISYLPQSMNGETIKS